MGRLKRLKKIRIHHEGTHTLIGGFLVLAVINLALYFGFADKLPFYIFLGISTAFYAIILLRAAVVEWQTQRT